MACGARRCLLKLNDGAPENKIVLLYLRVRIHSSLTRLQKHKIAFFFSSPASICPDMTIRNEITRQAAHF